MWVISGKYLFAGFPEALFLVISFPLVTRILNRTPLVQKMIDEFLPPLLSKRICNHHKEIGKKVNKQSGEYDSRTKDLQLLYIIFQRIRAVTYGQFLAL